MAQYYRVSCGNNDMLDIVVSDTNDDSSTSQNNQQLSFYDILNVEDATPFEHYPQQQFDDESPKANLHNLIDS